MLRFLVRLIGVFLFAAAFIALVGDGTRSIVGRTLSLTSTADAIGLFWPNAVAGWHRGLEAVWSPLSDPLLTWITAQPAVLIFGVLGILLMALGRPRPRMIRLSRA
jgi:hypothetical protein